MLNLLRKQSYRLSPTPLKLRPNPTLVSQYLHPCSWKIPPPSILLRHPQMGQRL